MAYGKRFQRERKQILGAREHSRNDDDDNDDDDDDDDDHFYSLRTRFYKVIYITDSLHL